MYLFQYRWTSIVTRISYWWLYTNNGHLLCYYINNDQNEFQEIETRYKNLTKLIYSGTTGHQRLSKCPD